MNDSEIFDNLNNFTFPLSNKPPDSYCSSQRNISLILETENPKCLNDTDEESGGEQSEKKTDCYGSFNNFDSQFHHAEHLDAHELSPTTTRYSSRRSFSTLPKTPTTPPATNTRFNLNTPPQLRSEFSSPFSNSSYNTSNQIYSTPITPVSESPSSPSSSSNPFIDLEQSSPLILKKSIFTPNQTEFHESCHSQPHSPQRVHFGSHRKMGHRRSLSISTRPLSAGSFDSHQRLSFIDTELDDQCNNDFSKRYHSIFDYNDVSHEYNYQDNNVSNFLNNPITESDEIQETNKREDVDRKSGEMLSMLSLEGFEDGRTSVLKNLGSMSIDENEGTEKNVNSSRPSVVYVVSSSPTDLKVDLSVIER